LAPAAAAFPTGPLGTFVIANEGDHDQWTQEIKLTGSAFDDKVDYTAGFFYFHEENDTDFIQAFSAFGLVSYDRLMTNEVDSWAIYGKADWHILDKVTISAGLRYTDETEEYGIRDNGNPLTPPPAAINSDALTAAGIPLEADESLVTPRFSLEWRPTDDIMLFGSATRGFKSGGWNARSGPASQQTPFDSEIVWSYELGARTEWWDNRIRANITAFYTDVEDFQLPSAFNDPATGAIVFITQNFADLEVKGLEFEFLAAPVDNLTLYANIGLMDSEYKNLNPSIIAQQARCSTMGMNCAEGIVNETGGIADPVRAPDYQVAIGGWYEFPLTANLSLTPRVNVTRYGEHNTSTSGQLVAIVDGYTLVSGGLTLDHSAQDWSLSVECRNCTDRDYFVSLLAGTQYLSDPMTWMARFTKRF
ncbi:MAG: TonB-dependent receptor, partial [Gammaproteobacteria bacterium]|nr:TonB-dependent receptor [Gammaproteobacteria bacterium]NNL99228.1 TonB-dependent receptor [Gammaproteobacteria bacterium]